MNETALQHFHETHVHGVTRAKWLALGDFYQKNREKLAADFLASFRQICRRICDMQKSGKKEKVAYLHYSMLRTAIIEQTYLWRVDAYDASWYRDRQECSTTYDATWAFQFLAELDAELEKKRQPYMNQIGRFDVERIILREAAKYQTYVVALARFAMEAAVKLPEYREIGRDSRFEVRAGQYFDQSEIVYIEDWSVKDPKEIKRWFEEKSVSEYAYEVYRGLNLSGGDYQGIDLRYADLRDSDLSAGQLSHAVLLGAKLGGSNLKGADLSRAGIYEADFRGSDLRGAILNGVAGACGWNGDADNWLPGFSRVNFSGANLEKTDFSDAFLNGADFRDAHLDGVKFEGAELNGAVFSKESQSQLQSVLDGEQRHKVVWG